MSKFVEKVREFIRAYVPEENLVEYETDLSAVDDLKDRLDGMMAKPIRKDLDLVRDVAYEYANKRITEYRTHQQLLGTIQVAFASVINDHHASIAKIETVPLRDGDGRPLYTHKDQTPEEYAENRRELFRRASDANKAKKLILFNDIKPLEIVAKRCWIFVKALSQLAMSEFPPPTRQTGWFPDRPISDSSDPERDPLKTSTHHEVSDLYAKRKLKVFTELLKMKETGKTRAQERAERKRIFEESENASAERVENLTALRAAKKADLDQKVEAMK